MTYEELLQQQPSSLAAGNQTVARTFVAAISGYLASGDQKTLTPSQVNYLYKLRAKWVIRAAGNDASWNQYGSRPGRRRQALIGKGTDVDKTAYGNEEDLDPLLASIKKKFIPSTP